jgi:hypothetical protein
MSYKVGGGDGHGPVRVIPGLRPKGIAGHRRVNVSAEQAHSLRPSVPPSLRPSIHLSPHSARPSICPSLALSRP